MKNNIKIECEKKISISEKVEKLAKQCLTNNLGLDLIFRKDDPYLITKDKNIRIKVIVGLTKEQQTIEDNIINNRYLLTSCDLSKKTIVDNSVDLIKENINELNNTLIAQKYINHLFILVVLTKTLKK